MTISYIFLDYSSRTKIFSLIFASFSPNFEIFSSISTILFTSSSRFLLKFSLMMSFCMRVPSFSFSSLSAFYSFPSNLFTSASRLIFSPIRFFTSFSSYCLFRFRLFNCDSSFLFSYSTFFTWIYILFFSSCINLNSALRLYSRSSFSVR